MPKLEKHTHTSKHAQANRQQFTISKKKSNVIDHQLKQVAFSYRAKIKTKISIVFFYFSSRKLQIHSSKLEISYSQFIQLFKKKGKGFEPGIKLKISLCTVCVPTVLRFPSKQKVLYTLHKLVQIK